MNDEMIKYKKGKKVENERARHMVNTLSVVNTSPYIVDVLKSY